MGITLCILLYNFIRKNLTEYGGHFCINTSNSTSLTVIEGFIVWMYHIVLNLPGI